MEGSFLTYNPILTPETIWCLIACLVFSALDIVTGFLQAVINKTVRSSKMRQGLLHKIMTVVSLSVLLAAEVFLANVPSLGIHIPLVVMASVVVITMELVSIKENIVLANPKLKESGLMDFFPRGGDKKE